MNTNNVRPGKCRACVDRTKHTIELCGRPALVKGLCQAHYQQQRRAIINHDPRNDFASIRPRGNMEEIKIRVPPSTVEGLYIKAQEERKSFPDICRNALATYLGGAENGTVTRRK